MNNIETVIAEIERRWRARMPATSVLDIDPSYRVNRSDLLQICEQQNIAVPLRDDDFDRALFQLYDRLRKEFPNERWEPRSHWTAATKARRKELGLR